MSCRVIRRHPFKGFCIGKKRYLFYPTKRTPPPQFQKSNFLMTKIVKIKKPAPLLVFLFYLAQQ
ncbi:hypothetical protein C1T30_21210 [Bacillus sp. MBGLi97]|nr:hypothetical protein C1T30_21210 [Bacillus sp. MBGLi97]